MPLRSCCLLQCQTPVTFFRSRSGSRFTQVQQTSPSPSHQYAHQPLELAPSNPSDAKRAQSFGANDDLPNANPDSDLGAIVDAWIAQEPIRLIHTTDKQNSGLLKPSQRLPQRFGIFNLHFLYPLVIKNSTTMFDNTMGQVKGWNAAENLLACKALVAASENSVKGNGQKKAKFEASIAREFDALINQTKNTSGASSIETRTGCSIAQRFKQMRKMCLEYERHIQ